MIKDVHLVNFMQHKDKIVNFQSGLNVIIGENGKGKSTILDAISYALFGEIPRKVPKKGIVNIDCKDKCKSFVKLITDDFVITRGLKSTPTQMETADGLVVEGISEVTSVVEKILGIDKYRFFNLFYISQGHLLDMVEMTAAERKKIFDKLFFVGMDFETWYNVFNQITKRYDDDFSVIKEMERINQELVKENKKLRELLIKMKKDIDDMIAEITEKKKELQHLRELLNEINKLSELKWKIEDIEHRLSDMKDLLVDSDEINNWKKELDRLTKKMSSIKSIDDIKLDLKFLKSLLDNWQAWMTWDKDRYVKELAKNNFSEDDMNTLEDSRKVVLNTARSGDEKEFLHQIKIHELKVLKVGYNEYQTKDAEYLKKYQPIYDSYQTFSSLIRKYKISNRIDLESIIVKLEKIVEKSDMIMEILSEISDLKLRISRAEESRKNYSKLLEQKNGLTSQLMNQKGTEENRNDLMQKISEFETVIETLLTRKTNLLEEGNNLKFKYKDNKNIIELNESKIDELKRKQIQFETFKSIKTLFHKDKLPALYRSIIYQPFINRLQYYITTLGFDFEINMDEKFNFTTDQLPNINLLSGGQKVALSLAVRFAVADLLGLHLDFILIDEPTIHLDDIRIDEVAKVLQDVSQTMQVIVVSHHSKLAEYGHVLEVF